MAPQKYVLRNDVGGGVNVKFVFNRLLKGGGYSICRAATKGSVFVFPIKIDDRTSRFPAVTIILILICCLIYWKQSLLFPEPGLVPLDILHSILHFDSALPVKLLSLFTAFFLHGSIMHLAGNIWYLWIFGSALEQFLKGYVFLSVYCLFGVISQTAQVVSDPLSTIPIVGASGAIAGIMGMYLIIRPFSRIIIWFPPIFIFRPPSALFLVGWFWLQWYNVRSGSAATDNIAWWAHIGGFTMGILAGVFGRMRGLYGINSGNRSRKGKQ